MRLLFALVFLALTAGTGEAELLWVNNITVNEYNMTWGYTETFTGVDSMMYRINIDAEYGNNDSFISAWELLEADKEIRKQFRNSIDSELDVRIDNRTSGIEVLDVDSTLTPDTIGKTHINDTIVNRYKVNYRLNNSIFNAESIWFLGQPQTPITVVMPPGVDVINISGMSNITRNITDHVEISGIFINMSEGRGEVTLNLTRNLSVNVPEINVTAQPEVTENVTKSLTRVISRIRDASIVGVGIIIILLIYVFKLRRGQP